MPPTCRYCGLAKSEHTITGHHPFTPKEDTMPEEPTITRANPTLELTIRFFHGAKAGDVARIQRELSENDMVSYAVLTPTDNV